MSACLDTSGKAHGGLCALHLARTVEPRLHVEMFPLIRTVLNRDPSSIIPIQDRQYKGGTS